MLLLQDSAYMYLGILSFNLFWGLFIYLYDLLVDICFLYRLNFRWLFIFVGMACLIHNGTLKLWLIKFELSINVYNFENRLFSVFPY